VSGNRGRAIQIIRNVVRRSGHRHSQVIIPIQTLAANSLFPQRAFAMLTHAQIWAAIDRLAARAGLSASGLAKRAGLDPTTFNKSKRITRQGRERWPSTESVAKSLAATGVSLDEFVGLISEHASEAPRKLPVLSFAQATGAGHFDPRGQPTGKD